MSNEELIVRYQTTTDPDEKAQLKEQFFKQNQKLLHFWVNKYRKFPIPYDEVQGRVTEALVVAFNDFEPAKGLKYTTFAGVVVHHLILKYLRKKRPLDHSISFNQVVHDGGGQELTLEDMLEDTSSDFLEATHNHVVCSRIFDIAHRILSRRDYHIFVHTFSTQPKTQVQLAKHHGISQVQVSRLLVRSLKRIKKYMKKEGESVMSITDKTVNLPETSTAPTVKQVTQSEQLRVVPKQKQPERSPMTAFQKVEAMHKGNLTLKPREIAEKTGVPLNSVRTYLSKLKKDALEGTGITSSETKLPKSQKTTSTVKKEVQEVSVEVPALVAPLVETPTTKTDKQLGIDLTLTNVTSTAASSVLTSVQAMLDTSKVYEIEIKIKEIN